MAVIFWNKSVKQLIQNLDLLLCLPQHLLAIRFIYFFNNYVFPLLNLLGTYQSKIDLFMLLNHSIWNACLWLLRFRFISVWKRDVYPVWTKINVNFFPRWRPRLFSKSRQTVGKSSGFLQLPGTSSVLLFKHPAQANTLGHCSGYWSLHALLLWRLCFCTFSAANFKILEVFFLYEHGLSIVWLFWIAFSVYY